MLFIFYKQLDNIYKNRYISLLFLIFSRQLPSIFVSNIATSYIFFSTVYYINDGDNREIHIVSPGNNIIGIRRSGGTQIQLSPHSKQGPQPERYNPSQTYPTPEKVGTAMLSPPISVTPLFNRKTKGQLKSFGNYIRPAENVLLSGNLRETRRIFCHFTEFK